MELFPSMRSAAGRWPCVESFQRGFQDGFAGDGGVGALPEPTLVLQPRTAGEGGRNYRGTGAEAAPAGGAVGSFETSEEFDHRAADGGGQVGRAGVAADEDPGVAQEDAEFGEVGLAGEVDQTGDAGAELVAEGAGGGVVERRADDEDAGEAVGPEEFPGEPGEVFGGPAVVERVGRGVEDGIGLAGGVKSIEPGVAQADAERLRPAFGEVDSRTESVEWRGAGRRAARGGRSCIRPRGARPRGGDRESGR